MSRRGAVAVGVLVSSCLAWGCSNSTASPPRTLPEASDEDVIDSGPDVESDVVTPEGCLQGESCDCVGLVSACMGGTAKSCFMQMDCEMSVTQADMLCVGADGGSAPGVCARRCAKDGGCTPAGMMVTCPAGYVCEQAPIGPSFPVCIVSHALMPPDCTIDADCNRMIPGSKCTAQGCVLACTN